MKTMKSVSVLIAAAMCSVASHADTSVLVDFNTAGDLSDFAFNPASQYTEDAAGGIGGAGGVDVAGNANIEASYTPFTMAFTNTGDTVTQSIDFLFDDSGNAGASANVVRLGFANGAPDTDDNWIENPGGVGAGSPFGGLQQSGTDTVRLRHVMQTLTLDPDGNVTLTDGVWYRYTYTLTLIDDAVGRFQSVSTLESLGASGTDAPTMVADFTNAQNNPSLVGVTAYGAFMAQTAFGGGAEELDNYTTTIPEPGSLSLLGLGVLAIARRKRSSR